LGSSGSGLTNNLQHHIKSSTFIFNFSIGSRVGQAMNSQPAEIPVRWWQPYCDTSLIYITESFKQLPKLILK
jgi:hypothetical protein